MKSFDERLSSIQSKRRQDAATDRVVASTARSYDHADSDGVGFGAVFLFPVAVLIGALSVIAGGVIKVAIVDGGLSPGTLLPPDLGVLSYAMGFAAFFAIDLVFRMGKAGQVGVAIGFFGMMFGEQFLLDAFPEVWIDLYQAEYLEFALGERAYEDLFVVPEDQELPAPLAADSSINQSDASAAFQAAIDAAVAEAEAANAAAENK
ncbi:MAG: hypothetical protein AAGA70_15190 [Pseudomonadota bacterium]